MIGDIFVIPTLQYNISSEVTMFLADLNDNYLTVMVFQLEFLNSYLLVDFVRWNHLLFKNTASKNFGNRPVIFVYISHYLHKSSVKSTLQCGRKVWSVLTQYYTTYYIYLAFIFAIIGLLI